MEECLPGKQENPSREPNKSDVVTCNQSTWKYVKFEVIIIGYPGVCCQTLQQDVHSPQVPCLLSPPREHTCVISIGKVKWFGSSAEVNPDS